MTNQALFQPYHLGPITLANHIVMAPLTRNRASAGLVQVFAFGRPFISNPDLVERLKTGAPLAPLDPETLYGGGAAGYTDYPSLTQTSQ